MKKQTSSRIQESVKITMIPYYFLFHYFIPLRITNIKYNFVTHDQSAGNRKCKNRVSIDCVITFPPVIFFLETRKLRVYQKRAQLFDYRYYDLDPSPLEERRGGISPLEEIEKGWRERQEAWVINCQAARTRGQEIKYHRFLQRGWGGGKKRGNGFFAERGGEERGNTLRRAGNRKQRRKTSRVKEGRELWCVFDFSVAQLSLQARRPFIINVSRGVRSTMILNMNYREGNRLIKIF